MAVAFLLLAALPVAPGAFTTVKFPSADGLLVTADLYGAGDKSRPVMVLFHQSGSSRGEYRRIAPELVKLGFVVWGSSFSATLVFQIAAEEPDLVAAVVSYSPGQYDGQNPGRVRGWARRVTQPVYVSCGARRDEQDLARPIYEAVSHTKKTLYVPAKGGHGASIVLDDPPIGIPSRAS